MKDTVWDDGPEKNTNKGWGDWLGDHWWRQEKRGKRTFYIDPINEEKHLLGKAIDIQIHRDKDIFILPSIVLEWYQERKTEYYNYVEICRECDGDGCLVCFRTGYVYGFFERPISQEN